MLLFPDQVLGRNKYYSLIHTFFDNLVSKSAILWPSLNDWAIPNWKIEVSKLLCYDFQLSSPSMLPQTVHLEGKLIHLLCVLGHLHLCVQQKVSNLQQKENRTQIRKLGSFFFVSAFVCIYCRYRPVPKASCYWFQIIHAWFKCPH